MPHVRPYICVCVCVCDSAQENQAQCEPHHNFFFFHFLRSPSFIGAASSIADIAGEGG